MTRAEQIAAKEAEQAKAGVQLKEALELQKAVAKDIITARATSMRLRQEIAELRAAESKQAALRQAYALDPKKSPADAMTPTARLDVAAFVDAGKKGRAK